jgi:hypothetical protein
VVTLTGLRSNWRLVELGRASRARTQGRVWLGANSATNRIFTTSSPRWLRSHRNFGRTLPGVSNLAPLASLSGRADKVRGRLAPATNSMPASLRTLVIVTVEAPRSTSARGAPVNRPSSVTFALAVPSRSARPYLMALSTGPVVDLIVTISPVESQK